jgi:hypothetical protein
MSGGGAKREMAENPKRPFANREGTYSGYLRVQTLSIVSIKQVSLDISRNAGSIPIKVKKARGLSGNC